MSETSYQKAYIVEFLGTFIIVLTTLWSFYGLQHEKLDYLGLALITGLVYSICIYIGKNLSGAHFSPNVTISNMLISNYPFAKGIIYILL